MNLRQKVLNITKLAINVFGTPVSLFAPDGTKYDTDIEGNSLLCQFLSGRISIAPDSGEEMVVFRPVATFHRSSLVRIPKNGEIWAVEAPLDPDKPEIKTMLTMDPSKSIEGGRSLGEIRLYLSETKQS